MQCYCFLLANTNNWQFFYCGRWCRWGHLLYTSLNIRWQSRHEIWRQTVVWNDIVLYSQQFTKWCRGRAAEETKSSLMFDVSTGSLWVPVSEALRLTRWPRLLKEEHLEPQALCTCLFALLREIHLTSDFSHSCWGFCRNVALPATLSTPAIEVIITLHIIITLLVIFY